MTWRCMGCGKVWTAPTVYGPCACGSNRTELIAPRCRIEGCKNAAGWGPQDDLCMRHEDMIEFAAVARMHDR